MPGGARLGDELGAAGGHRIHALLERGERFEGVVVGHEKTVTFVASEGQVCNNSYMATTTETATYEDPQPWVDDCFGGRWSTEKKDAYTSRGSSFQFSYEPRDPLAEGYFSSGQHRHIVRHNDTPHRASEPWNVGVCDSCTNGLGMNIRWDMAPCRKGDGL